MEQSPVGPVAVFGYGSLVNMTSLAETIGRHPGTVHYVNLQGWARDWSVAVSNSALRGRFVHADTGELPEYILALNIKKDPFSRFGVNGILFQASDKDLELLDTREFCYQRIEITNELLGDHPYETIYTYAGLPKYATPTDLPAVIPASYQQVVSEGFQSINQLAYKWYTHSTTPSSFDVMPTIYQSV
jgi:hypothetical protein